MAVSSVAYTGPSGSVAVTRTGTSSAPLNNETVIRSPTTNGVPAAARRTADSPPRIDRSGTGANRSPVAVCGSVGVMVTVSPTPASAPSATDSSTTTLRAARVVSTVTLAAVSSSPRTTTGVSSDSPAAAASSPASRTTPSVSSVTPTTVPVWSVVVISGGRRFGRPTGRRPRSSRR